MTGMNDKQQNKMDQVADAVALYAAEPEFNQRIAEEFMGWKLREGLGWFDSAGQNAAPENWSPMTDANAAIEVMRSPRWRSNWPNSVICFGPDQKSDVIIIWEKEGGVLQQLARAPRVPTAISLVAIRSLSSPAMN
jgi:hypothetical protein